MPYSNPLGSRSGSHKRSQIFSEIVNSSKQNSSSNFSSSSSCCHTKGAGDSSKYSNRPISDFFGELTFGVREMRERLSKEAYQSLLKTLDKGAKLSSETADSISLVIKEWAVSQGVTHFCHWFQPMTGLTAEKHDAFISIQHSFHSELHVIERFTGGQLIQSEPDASSFPSGGMRTTFEARGYTAWDPTSPLFIVEGENNKTLCIPSVFFGYHGESLDHKTPLLRSNVALSDAASEFLKLLGDVDVKFVTSTLGVEQEYFLIDKRFLTMRPDLLMSGRSLLGAPPHRGQQLEDHYFGSIPSRVLAYMEDLETELYRLGIPLKTRHNEVAPSQFELAPIFEDANIAVDHNALTMETMKRIANRHNFICLLHEKPFAGINGSGKHCNWSMRNEKGENLLEPGKTPHQNIRFLAVLAVILKAVHDHSDVLRASIASAGNDHRLGANEAPPAIISVFLGQLLNNIYETIAKGEVAQATESQIINLNVSHIPDISRDYTDRNRTSPFAFTGNKFEFRAVGSAANTAFPVATLNAAVADAFKASTSRLKKIMSSGKVQRDEALMELIRELVKETANIRFEGNNYSSEWHEEAAKRGLPILRTTVDALDVFKNKKSLGFLSELKIFSPDELASRHHIGVERYIKTLLIEHSTLVEMTSTMIIPTVENYLASAYGVRGQMTGPLAEIYKKRVQKIEDLFHSLLKSEESLINCIAKVNKEENDDKKMQLIKNEAIPLEWETRKYVDQLESWIPDELWPLPKYREMLFTHGVS